MIFSDSEKLLLEVAILLPTHPVRAEKMLRSFKDFYPTETARVRRWFRMLCFMHCADSARANGTHPDTRYWLTGFPRLNPDEVGLLRRVDVKISEALNCQDIDLTYKIACEVFQDYPLPIYPTLLQREYFKQGRWEDGWNVFIPKRPATIYAYLTSHPDLYSGLNLSGIELWDGSFEIRGKRLLVLARKMEWGYGDQFNFCWLYQPLIEAGIDTCFVFDKTTEPLIKSGLPQIKLWCGDPNIDYLCVNSFHLLQYLKLNPEKLERPKKYLKAPSSVVVSLPHLDTFRFRVGVCWESSERSLKIPQGLKRSIDIDALAPLFELPCDFYSLFPDSQSIEASKKYPISDLTGQLKSFSDTASVISQLDLVITVDTAIAHLAGGLGKPTWVLMQANNCDVRWGFTGERTGFYPTVRLFRQQNPGVWCDVVARIRASLEAVLSQIPISLT